MSLHEPGGLTAKGQNNADDGGLFVGTNYFSPNDFLNFSEKIENIDKNQHPSYWAVNTVTAYFDRMRYEVRNNIEKRVDGQTIHTPIGQVYHEIKKYLIILCNIALSGIIRGIECNIQYLRLGGGDDGNSLVSFKSKATAVGNGYLQEIYDQIAENLDSSAKAANSNLLNRKTNVLSIVTLNGIKVAYYSSKADGIMIYPFNTSLAVSESCKGLVGITCDENHYLQYDLDELFRLLDPANGDDPNDDRFYTENDRKFIAANLYSVLGEMENRLIGENKKGFEWIRTELQNRFTNINNEVTYVKLTDAEEYEYTPFGSAYNPKKASDSQKPVDGAGFEKFKIPFVFDISKTKVRYYEYNKYLEVESDDPRYSFKIMNPESNNLMDVNQVLPFDINLVATENSTIPLQVIVLGHDIGAVRFAYQQISGQWFKDSNEEIALNYVETSGVRKVKVFLDKVYDTSEKDTLDIYPLTSEFIELIKTTNATYNASEVIEVKYEDKSHKSIKVTVNVADAQRNNVGNFEKVYDSEDFYGEFPVGGGNIMDFAADMPELSIYPYVDIRNASNEPLLQRYYWTAIHGYSDQSLFDFITRLEIVDENGNKIEFSKADLRCYFKETTREYMITTTKTIPKTLYFTYVNGDKRIELGVLTLPKLTPIIIDANKKARVALDMGSRNSIIAMKVDANNTVYWFNRSAYRKYILSSTSKVDDFSRKVVGVEKEDIVDSFVSSYMVPYKVNTADNSAGEAVRLGGERKQPFVRGRIIATHDLEFYNQLLKFASKQAAPHEKDTLLSINVRSDFKRRFLEDVLINNHISPWVAYFITECAYRMTINALCEGCGNITLSFSAPDDNSKDKLTSVWNDVINIIMNNEIGVGMAGIQINVDEPMTEAHALYNYITYLKKTLKTYSFILDAGDSTIDLSLIETRGFDCPRLLTTSSLDFAGNRIIIESIVDVCEKCGITPEDTYENTTAGISEFSTNNQFQSIWNANGFNGLADLSEEADKIRCDLIRELFEDRNDQQFTLETWKSQSTYQILYRLVESSGTFDFVRNANTLSENIAQLIEIKYLFSLYIILSENIELVNDEDNIGVYLYGGTNNIGKNILWNRRYEEVLRRFVSKIFGSKTNRISIEMSNTDTSKKYDLVKGLVLDNAGMRLAAGESGEKTTEKVSDDASVAIINQQIEFVLDKDIFPNYWENEKCKLCYESSEEMNRILGLTFDKRNSLNAYQYAYQMLLGLDTANAANAFVEKHSEETRIKMFAMYAAVTKYLNNIVPVNGE